MLRGLEKEPGLGAGETWSRSSSACYQPRDHVSLRNDEHGVGAQQITVFFDDVKQTWPNLLYSNFCHMSVF